MLDIFLAADTFDWNVLIGIGTMIAAFGSIGWLIVTAKQSRESNYLDFIKDVDERFSDHLEKESNLTGFEDSIVYVYVYIDICEQIMFLVKNKKIPKDFQGYYLDFFNYAITMMWWYTTAYAEDKYSLKNSWPTLVTWILKKEGTPYPVIHLPTKMKDILGEKLKNPSEKEHITENEIYDQIITRIKASKN